MVYIVIWPRGDKHVYNSESQARKTMLEGDKIFAVDLVNSVTKEI